MGIKPSDLGALPPDWKAVKFGAITKVRQGLQIAISERLTKPTLTSQEYITIQSINRQNQGREYVESPSTRVTCKSDDVLMTRTGNTGIVVTGVEGAFHNNFFLIDFDRKELDSIFLVNYLRSPRVQHVLLTKAGASTIPDLNHKDFYSIDFPLAPLPEQKKIAKILSTWDKTITTTEQLLHNSQQQKKALMQQLLTGKKRLLDKNGVRFSGEWIEVSLSTICQINPKKPASPADGKVSFVAMEAVSEDAKLLSSVVRDYDDVCKGFTSFADNDVLVAKITPCFENGKGAYVEGMQNGIGFGSTEFHVLRAGAKSNSKYLYYLTNTSEFRVRGEANMQGSAGQKRVTTDYLKSLKVIVPTDVVEQQKIAAVLSTADHEISALQQKLDALKQEKKALMQQLLTGKRRVLVS
ncbi:restriction endonuclease subunit S [Vibrio fluvialis]|nr:restriction endonuclease subunit S [Vibrio fluvialis]